MNTNTDTNTDKYYFSKKPEDCQPSGVCDLSKIYIVPDTIVIYTTDSKISRTFPLNEFDCANFVEFEPNEKNQFCMEKHKNEK